MTDNNKLISQLSKKLNLRPDEVKTAAASGNYEGILQKADEADREKIKGLLNNPEKMKQVLSSPAAQRLIEMLNDKK